MISILHTLGTTAMVIGLVVMLSWVVVIVWFIFITVDEFRCNRKMKRSSEREFDNLRSSWLLEMRQYQRADGSEYFDTVEIPIRFKFDNYDILDTVETAAVIDIRERYPHEFAQHPQARQ